MLSTKPQNFIAALAAAGVFLLLLASCSVVPRKYPNGKPFVYETNINLETNLSKEDKSNLKADLKNQLDDSMRVRTVHKLWYKGFNRSVLEKPPVYDSTNADRSILFMKALLNARGYFRNSISYDTVMNVKEEAKPPQLRTRVNFNVATGPVFTLDSVNHIINHPELQAITDASASKSLLKKGKPFSKQIVNDELNRMVNLYRENGYLKFTFSELVGIWDTLNVALLRPAFDPFEQLKILEEFQRRKDSPTANISIRLRAGSDPERFKKYFVGHTTIYTDSRTDSSDFVKKLHYQDNDYSIYIYRDLFKSKFVLQNVSLHRGDLYNQKNVLKTLNRFNQLGAWRFVNLEQLPRLGEDTVDFTLYLAPAQKYSFSANIEGSYNSSNSIVLQENLFGIGANVQLTNRNFGRTSNQATTTARYTTEVDSHGEFVKTIQASISHVIVFPKPIPNARWIPAKLRDNFKTELNFSLGNLDRREFFNLTSLNASWGYNFQWKNKGLRIRIPNIEFTYVQKRDSLIEYLDNNPSLRTVFPENGLVLSTQLGFSIRGGHGTASHIFRTNFEASGLATSNINLKVFDSLFKYVRLDMEFIRNIQLGKNSFVFRIFAGTGVAMTTDAKPTQPPNMPFYKQFTAGGPYSMRAWRSELLGPGSTVKSHQEAPIRFGDFQFETNAEFRFPVTKLGGYGVYSCVFTDIGNVWFLRPHADFPEGTITSKYFLRDLGVGVGTGLRFDFEFIRLRFDYALKVKDPSPEPQDIAGQHQWFYDFNPFKGVVQFGINFPFAF